MPGMATSRTRHLVSAIDSEARNSSADENARAWKPKSFSKSGKDSRTDSSSSTTVIRGRVTISYDSQLVFSSSNGDYRECTYQSWMSIVLWYRYSRPIPKYRSILWCNRFPFVLVIYSRPLSESKSDEVVQKDNHHDTTGRRIAPSLPQHEFHVGY